MKLMMILVRFLYTVLQEPPIISLKATAHLSLSLPIAPWRLLLVKKLPAMSPCSANVNASPSHNLSRSCQQYQCHAKPEKYLSRTWSRIAQEVWAELHSTIPRHSPRTMLSSYIQGNGSWRKHAETKVKLDRFLRTKKDRDRYKFKQEEIIGTVIEGKVNYRRESKGNCNDIGFLSYGTVWTYSDQWQKNLICDTLSEINIFERYTNSP